LLIGLPKQLYKVDHPSPYVHPYDSLSPVASGNSIQLKLCLFDNISSITISWLFRVGDLPCIRLIIDQTTARNNDTVLNHSKLDYCNSTFVNHPAYHRDRLQLFLNSAARLV
jgi:hypothetical protein